MRMQFGFSLAVVFLAAGLACAGQDGPARTPPQKIPAGKLSGTVYCADSNLPARGATIYLFQITEAGFGSRSGPQTDLDGRFFVNDLEEGDYYVIAVFPGYMNLLSSLSQSHLDAMTPEDRKQMLGSLARATVSLSQLAQVSVRLERADGIDGTVTYDDGSPAIGLRIGYKLKSPDPKTPGLQARFMEDQVFGQNGPPVTDDQGRFRILGVPPGEYAVHVIVPLRSSEETEHGSITDTLRGPFSEDELDVYVGGGLRESKSDIIKVDSGGASNSADITIPLSKLHTIRGQVVLKTSGQPPVNADVQLLYADDKEQVRSVFAPNGEFEIFFVPEENYILRAAAGSEPPPDIEKTDASGARPQHVIWHFPQANESSPEIPLRVTSDVENVSISVPDPVIKKNGPYMEINRDGGGFVSSSDQ